MSYANGKGNLLRGSVCGRGNGTLDGYTQPDRITTPLKRAGKRGEGKWKPISWDQLINEVVEGGKLFEEILRPSANGWITTGIHIFPIRKSTFAFRSSMKQHKMSRRKSFF